MLIKTHQAIIALLISLSCTAFCLSVYEHFTVAKTAILCILALYLWLMAGADRLSETMREDGVAVAAVLFIFSQSISTLFSVDWRVSMLGQFVQPFHGMAQLLLCFLLYVGVSANRDKISIKNIGAWITTGASIVSVFGIVQWLYPEVLPLELPNGRIFSTLGGPVYLGSFLALCIPIVLHLFMARNLNIFIITIMAFALYLTKTRSAMIGAIAGCLLYLKLCGYINVRMRNLLFAGALMVVIGAGASNFMGRGRADTMRLGLWRVCTYSIAKNPWLGSGPDTVLLQFKRYRDKRYMLESNDEIKNVQGSAHNDILQVLVTGGALGLFMYFLLLGAISFKLYNAMRGAAPDYVAAVAGSFFSIFITAKLNLIPVIPIMGLFALMLGSVENDT